MERARELIRSLKAVADLLLPRTCIACERALLLEEEHLCSDCLADLPLTRFHLLRHNPMADRFNAIIQEYLEPIWTAGNAAHERYAYATALFFYDGESSYSHITHRLKYDGQLSVGHHFGRMLGEEIRRTPMATGCRCNNTDTASLAPTLEKRIQPGRNHRRSHIFSDRGRIVPGHS